MRGKFRSLVGVFLVGGVAAGCASNSELKARFNGRWGPDPTIQAAEFGTAAQNQTLVLTYLARSAGLVAADGTFVRQLTAADYTEIAQWGFNIGRQDCEIYMDNLFRISREKGRNDNILAALSTAAAGIITGTTTAQKPLSILAAVFGLSIALNDAVFQSYLFSEAPGLVSKKIADLQDVFRNSVVSGQIQVTTASSAYYAIQSYYRICLPHAIEGVMLQTIADAKPATPPAIGTVSGVALRSVTRADTMRTPELKLGK
jgi:hypothetical protein